MTSRALARTSALAITLALGIACDEPVSKVPTGVGTPGPSATGVEIIGPPALAPGESAQFNASIRLSDGTSKFMSPGSVSWRIGNPLYLQVNNTGIVTALPRLGETTVSVTVRVGTQTRSATRELVVIPAGTYRLAGRITELGAPAQPVGGAKVEVAQSTLATTTDFNGQFKLYGVPASAVIRVSATGYADLEQALTLTSHTTRNFEMDLSGPRPTLSGPYTLSIDAASSCPPGLASDLRTRRYDAVLTTNGQTIEVELTEPRFRLNSLGRGNKFTGRTIGNGVIFTLRPYSVSDSYWYYYYYYFFYPGPLAYPDVAERLSDNSFLVIDGQATATLSGSSLSGVLAGQLGNWDPRFPSFPRRLSNCSSSTHQFVFTPR